MAKQDLAGKAQTVLGLIEPEQLGVTHTHEHLLVSTAVLHKEPEEAAAKGRYYAPVSMEILGWLRHGRGSNWDNARLDDVQTTIDEVLLYKQFGGSTLVDATSIGIGRDPIGLTRISRETGVNIIMGSSYYVAAAHPAGMDGKSEDDLTREIAGDTLVGVGSTRIKAGVMGEIGCSWPLHPNERKVLRASARAQRITGAPILIHPGRDEKAPMEIMQVLLDAGAEAEHIIIGHLDRTIFDLKLLKELADTGCFLEYDVFGQETSLYPAASYIDMPNDAQRLKMLAYLISEGHGGQILVSHDVAVKHRLVRYGGHGYCYFLEYMVPRMRVKGFEEEAIEAMLVDNPRRALTFAESKDG